MFLRRLALTAGSLAVVAFCASEAKLPRLNSTVEQQATLRSFADKVDVRANQLFQATDWKLYQSSKDTSVSYKGSPDHNGEVYRIDLMVNSPMDTVVPVLMSLYKRETWDPDVKEHVIEDLGKGVAILHTTYETSGVVAKIVSPRDFCRIEVLKRHKDGMVSMAYDSIDHPGCEPMRGFVRGQVFTSGMFCAPCKEDATKTRIIFIYQSDAKVYVPGYILHMTNCRRGFEMADELKQAAERAASHAK